MASSGNSKVSSLTEIAACHQPILFLVTEFVAGSVQDAARWCSTVSFSLAAQMDFIVNAVFSKLYAKRWPAFHQAMHYIGKNDWPALYREMLGGRTKCILEVVHREKKPGFSMSAMPAWVHYRAREDAYEAHYISASAVLPELIPVSEDSRLRFAATAVREQLLPQRHTGLRVGGFDEVDATYPFRVFQGMQGLVPGTGVEIQWKMQEASPFGWWYGELEDLRLFPDGTTATATVTFRQFPANSRWYRMKLRFGDSAIRDCMFGGYTGGIRPTTQAEKNTWLGFLP